MKGLPAVVAGVETCGRAPVETAAASRALRLENAINMPSMAKLVIN
jgi:hypothetical protein